MLYVLTLSYSILLWRQPIVQSSSVLRRALCFPGGLGGTRVGMFGGALASQTSESQKVTLTWPQTRGMHSACRSRLRCAWLQLLPLPIVKHVKLRYTLYNLHAQTAAASQPRMPATL